MFLNLIATLSFFIFTAASQGNSTFSPARPPSFPLAVKSPYLSTWLQGGSSGSTGGYLPGQWPSFWTGQWLGWTGMIRVDGETFTWLGAPLGIQNADQISAEYTSTRSIFTIHASDKVKIKVTFLSPITPNDYERQSLVFSYMNLDVSSLDNSEHEVQIYTDISAEWVSYDLTAPVEWEAGTTSDGVKYHKVWKQNQITFGETSNRADWGNVYYATEDNEDLTYQSGGDSDLRGAFKENGKLENVQDENFRAVNDHWPVFSYAVNLGSVGSEPISRLFTVGLCQAKAIQFLGADGLKNVPSLWTSYHEDELAALSYFYHNYSESSMLSTELDEKIAKDSKDAAGDDYALITTLAARQSFGTVQLVGNQDKHYLFMKEISSNGNMQTVDVIYPASPMFFYLNPDLVKLMLDPHFENQENGHYPNKYAIHDLGSHYPNATGHADGQDEPMPLEECGNHMMMMLLYAQLTGETDYIKSHYEILKQWTEYLVTYSLIPEEQLSTDDFAGKLANQTNLALKGIIGLEAMSQMAKLIDEQEDAKHYTEIAHDYIDKWQQLGINHDANPKHSVLTYNNMSTHGLLYNLYNDKLLNLSLVPQEVYDIQSDFYPTVRNKYGVALDTRHAYLTKSDWEIFCAAIASKDTKKMFVDDLANWVKETRTKVPMSDLFRIHDGDLFEGISFLARPVVGGMFALLLLDSEGYRAPERML